MATRRHPEELEHGGTDQGRLEGDSLLRKPAVRRTADRAGPSPSANGCGEGNDAKLRLRIQGWARIRQKQASCFRTRKEPAGRVWGWFVVSLGSLCSENSLPAFVKTPQGYKGEPPAWTGGAAPPRSPGWQPRFGPLSEPFGNPVRRGSHMRKGRMISPSMTRGGPMHADPPHPPETPPMFPSTRGASANHILVGERLRMDPERGLRALDATSRQPSTASQQDRPWSAQDPRDGIPLEERAGVEGLKAYRDSAHGGGILDLAIQDRAFLARHLGMRRETSSRRRNRASTPGLRASDSRAPSRCRWIGGIERPSDHDGCLKAHRPRGDEPRPCRSTARSAWVSGQTGGRPWGEHRSIRRPAAGVHKPRKPQHLRGFSRLVASAHANGLATGGGVTEPVIQTPPDRCRCGP